MPELSDRLMALLFIAAEPVDIASLAIALETTAEAVSGGLDGLASQLEGGPLRLSRHHDRYCLVTATEHSDDVRRLLQAEAKTELSRPAMETLAIIAYRGPVTKASIDALRGVASDTMLRNLRQRGLIVEQGTADEPGRPQLYAVSHTFLQQVGLTSLDQLPPLPGPESQTNEA